MRPGLGLGVPTRGLGEAHSGPVTEPMWSTQSSGMPGEVTRCTGGGVVGGVGATEPPEGISTGSQESLTCMETGTCTGVHLRRWTAELRGLHKVCGWLTCRLQRCYTVTFMADSAWPLCRPWHNSN